MRSVPKLILSGRAVFILLLASIKMDHAVLKLSHRILKNSKSLHWLDRYKMLQLHRNHLEYPEFIFKV
jgi:hypothetical protein